MERNIRCNHGYRLESQIREAFGKVTYTQTSHDKMIRRLLRKNNRIKIWQMILSGITTSGFIACIFADEKWTSILGAVVSGGLLILNSYTKNFNLVEQAQEHKLASDVLWKIREEYVTLLTDFEALESSEIMAKRDELQNRTAEVYSKSPKTDEKSYTEAKKAIKEEEEQFFSEKELDDMLPESIRRANRKFQS